jgi:hypothetical protein
MKEMTMGARKEAARVARLDRKIERVNRKIAKWSERKVVLETERDLGKKGKVSNGRRQARTRR